MTNKLYYYTAIIAPASNPDSTEIAYFKANSKKQIENYLTDNEKVAKLVYDPYNYPISTDISYIDVNA